MGEPIKVTSFRLGPDTLRELDEQIDVFAPAFGTRAALLRWLINLGHTIFVRHQGEEIVRQLQLLLCITKSHTHSAGAEPAELAGSVSSPRATAHRPCVVIERKFSPLGYFRSPVGEEAKATFCTSFQANRGLVFAGAQS